MHLNAPLCRDVENQHGSDQDLRETDSIQRTNRTQSLLNVYNSFFYTYTYEHTKQDLP